MKLKKLRLLTAMAVMIVFVASSTVASAAVWSLAATLDGLQETPPNGSPGSGFASLTLDDVSGLVTVTSGSFFGLVAPASAAHIHGPAPVGVAAGVLIGLSVPPATSGPISGSGTLSAPNVSAMLGGLTYVNIHSSAFPGGEIRGQITTVPEPSTLAMAGLGLGALLWRARRKQG